MRVPTWLLLLTSVIEWFTQLLYLSGFQENEALDPGALLNGATNLTALQATSPSVGLGGGADELVVVVFVVAVVVTVAVVVLSGSDDVEVGIEFDFNLPTVVELDLDLVGGAAVADLGFDYGAAASVGERGVDGWLVGVRGDRLVIAATGGGENPAAEPASEGADGDEADDGHSEVLHDGSIPECYLVLCAAVCGADMKNR